MGPKFYVLGAILKGWVGGWVNQIFVQFLDLIKDSSVSILILHISPPDPHWTPFKPKFKWFPQAIPLLSIEIC